MYRKLLTLGFLGAFSLGILQAYEPKTMKQKSDLGVDAGVVEWKLPKGVNEDGTIDRKLLPQNNFGDMIALGNEIINHTSKHIGPMAPKDKQFAGNNLSCASCHAPGGIRKDSAGFVGIAARFPSYSSRADKFTDLYDRINGCMQRSMNGKPLSHESTEMRAMVYYMTYLSLGTPIGAKTKGQGLIKLEHPKRAADPKKGEKIFAANCASCHGVNGEGFLNPDPTGDKYLFPPVWGDDSYNTGAGMYRIIKAASFIKANMPLNNPHLSTEEAFDVAAFINSKPRPVKANRDKDFPDRRVKAIDMDVGDYDDGLSTKRHKYGPWNEDMIKNK